MAQNGIVQKRTVNVWFDRPGDFLEVGWSSQWAVNGCEFPDTDYWFQVDLTEDFQAVGFQAIGALHFADRCDGEAALVADVQPHPVSVKYDRAADLWDVSWGPDAVDCVATPNPRIRARVDAAGQIQGVLISDLRTFEEEILNQDLYPAPPGQPVAGVSPEQSVQPQKT